jgi:hypothetical protein
LASEGRKKRLLSLESSENGKNQPNITSALNWTINWRGEAAARPAKLSSRSGREELLLLLLLLLLL